MWGVNMLVQEGYLMSTIAVAGVRQQVLAIRRQQILALQRPQIGTVRSTNPLVSVLAWELRRILTSRRFWLQILALFGFLLLLTWAQSKAFVFSMPSANGFVAGTSAWGLLLSLPTTVLLLVLFLPFVNADGVTRDLQRGTHELLMTTPLPTWAYVWGRYLSGLLMSLGLAVLLLAALLGMGEVLHLTNPAYPSPQVGTVLLLWGSIVVPATVLVSSLSFALGTLFPRQSALVKIGILVAWAVGAYVIPIMLYFPAGPNHLPTGYSSWDPTSALTGLVLFAHYNADAHQLTSSVTNTAQMQHLLNTVANKVPDISPWLAPHVIEALLSFLLVLVATVAFRRFRAVFGDRPLGETPGRAG
jgi:ABC-type transport system involved in multi-copper enzyme maturation permease subunit